MMLENFIYAKQKSLFEKALNNGEVLDEAIVFIEDTKEIWNHGTYFDGSKVDLSNIEEAISKIKTDGNGLMYLNDKGEYEIPQIIVDSEEELNSITPEIGTRAVVRNIVEGYDNLNLAKILNGEETNVPADMFDALDKYAFKVTSVDTSIQFPYQEGEEHTVYELFTLGPEEFEMVTNQDGSSILRVYINSAGAPLTIYSGYGQDFYWQDNTILERIITADNIMSIMNLGQNVVNAFLLFSTALNVSIIANNECTNYCYTSKGWIQSNYITEQQLYIFGFNMLSNFSEQIPTRVSQLENDANYIQDDVVSDGVYAVDANGKLIDYNTADSSCLGVALVKGEHKFMIAKSDATNDGSNYDFYYDCTKGDLSLTNYSKADGTNRYGYFGGSSTPQLSTDFTTWTEGALSDFNGKSNTQVIAASSSNADDMCKVLETFNAGSDNQGHSDWYVPAAGQLALMYLAKTDINAALAKIGGTAFESLYYWSSSEYGAKIAWGVFFDSGLVGSNNKYNYCGRVRFVRDISTPKSLKERVSNLESLPKINAITDNSVYVNNLELPVYTALSERCIKSCKGIEYDNDKVLIDAYGINFIPEDTDSPDSKTWNIHSRGDGTKFLSDDGYYKEIEANIQAVDTTDEIEDVETNTYIKYVAQTLTEEQKAQVRENIGVNAQLGDINTILESIINGGFVNSIFPITLTMGNNGQTAVDLYNYVVQNHENGQYFFKENEIVEYNSNVIPYFNMGGSIISYDMGGGIHLVINQSGMVMVDAGAGN